MVICLLAFEVIAAGNLDTPLSLFISLWVGALIAFLYFNVWPANFWVEKQKRPELTILEHLPEDFNYKYFHNKNGASVVCVVDGGSGKLAKMTEGFGFIAGYTSHLRPSDDFLAVLEKIGKTVERMLR